MRKFGVIYVAFAISNVFLAKIVGESLGQVGAGLVCDCHHNPQHVGQLVGKVEFLALFGGLVSVCPRHDASYFSHLFCQNGHVCQGREITDADSAYPMVYSVLRLADCDIVVHNWQRYIFFPIFAHSNGLFVVLNMENLSNSSLLAALLLTLLAGMGTGIGALMSLLPQARSSRFLAGALGFSAGVMLYVSFLDLMPQAVSELIGALGSGRRAELYAVLAFFGGILLIALIDFLVPEKENPHEYSHPAGEKPSRSKKGGIMLALAIAIHNFPEGMATFISALDGAAVAVPIVIAILLHNIPEGIAVMVPVYNATGNRRKALVWSVLSGLAEPLGAIAGMMFLLPLWTPTLNAVVLAAVAGIMVYISLDELLPSAESHGHHHISITFVILGMALMALSVLMA